MGRSRRLLALGLFAAVLPWPTMAGAQAVDRMVTIQGVPVSIEEQSVKCDLKLPSWVSDKRLANCDSATLIMVAGSKASILRFEIAPGDPTISEGHRAELRDMFEARNGDEVWYRFSTILPRDFPFAPGTRLVTAQWHERMPDGSPPRRPPLAHRIVDRAFWVTLWDDAAYEATKGVGNGVMLVDDPEIATEVVHEFVYRIVWKLDAGGRVTGWRRENTCSAVTFECKQGTWREFVNRRGPIGYAESAGYYFKIGVYTTHKFPKPLIVFHRGYRRGPDAASVGAEDAIFRIARR